MAGSAGTCFGHKGQRRPSRATQPLSPLSLRSAGRLHLGDLLQGLGLHLHLLWGDVGAHPGGSFSLLLRVRSLAQLLQPGGHGGDAASTCSSRQDQPRAAPATPSPGNLGSAHSHLFLCTLDLKCSFMLFRSTK